MAAALLSDRVTAGGANHSFCGRVGKARAERIVVLSAAAVGVGCAWAASARALASHHTDSPQQPPSAQTRPINEHDETRRSVVMSVSSQADPEAGEGSAWV